MRDQLPDTQIQRKRGGRERRRPGAGGLPEITRPTYGRKGSPNTKLGGRVPDLKKRRVGVPPAREEAHHQTQPVEQVKVMKLDRKKGRAGDRYRLAK